MIEKKLKRCKGTNKAKGFESCGEMSMIKLYGLCSNCYRKWLLTTKEGADYIKKNTIRAKKEIETKNKEEKKKAKIAIKSIAVLKQEAKAPFQKLIRIRDHGKNCICCNRPLPFNIGDYDGGHFKKAEVYSGLILHPDNIHGQLTYCNKYQHGNEAAYSIGLIERIGQKRYDELIELSIKFKDYKWDRSKLIELKEYYRKELNKVEKGIKDIKDVDLTLGIIN